MTNKNTQINSEVITMDFEIRSLEDFTKALGEISLAVYKKSENLKKFEEEMTKVFRYIGKVFCGDKNALPKKKIKKIVLAIYQIFEEDNKEQTV